MPNSRYSKIVKGERNTKRSLLIFIAEPLPILFKDSERREKYKKKLAYFLLPSRSLSYSKIVKGESGTK